MTKRKQDCSYTELEGKYCAMELQRNIEIRAHQVTKGLLEVSRQARTADQASMKSLCQQLEAVRNETVKLEKSDTRNRELLRGLLIELAERLK
jgi:hypothetical protein